ncbi:tRNA (adenosine(37)-N6)-threonylcarbamoyltransferase complex ATPase subunit type 1 TsaE [Candidatus Kuenenbacteria bacterium RIFCSPHIGHO2_02_FULL_39_13]|uniref:tRNA threonylcarbamoyladenosine biosynthesis protein TsaE n=1 Tax=Candidatus Kuenenbacteria bacterium RIFCSPHIGHO2_02_FULL_39_13 TaxID=1798561 RepID=A0A1F6FLE6_9BACT|nr:MAG: tRNA (adenosine(37)-N6)-threonylcarbamoyltransferase complex ATPase subunit type 1 TsaE [Candidatus Kuenenbacteria bacterium RIFCSPHIGHO2_02_FULL_39_13]
MSKIIITNSEKETINFGKKFVAQLKAGTIIGLVGKLGAGKTQFVKGLAQGLGIKNNITSPTFVLLKTYNLPARHRCAQALAGGQLTTNDLQLIHVDCYRLSSPEELADIGWRELVSDKNNIIVVEWADKIRKIMPKNTIWIKFSIGKKDNQRKISI